MGCDLGGGVQSLWGKLAALPLALRRGGIGVLRPKSGNFTDAIKRSEWMMSRLSKTLQKRSHWTECDYDVVLGVGTTIPLAHCACPYFIYTDLTILANLYYPQGERQVELWKECLPYERANVAGARAVFTMSEHIGRSLREHYRLPAERIVRVNAGCNGPRVNIYVPDRFKRMNILFIGVEWERKGGKELEAAFRLVRSRLPNATLTVVGCRPVVAVGGIDVVGPVPPQRVGEYLARASVFCLPSPSY